MAGQVSRLVKVGQVGEVEVLYDEAVGDPHQHACGICGASPRYPEPMWGCSCGNHFCSYSVGRCAQHGGGQEVERLMRQHLVDAHSVKMTHEDWERSWT